MMGDKTIEGYISGFKKRMDLAARQNIKLREKTYEKLDLVVNRLKEEKSIIRIFLFGSFARDDYTESSDIDLAIDGKLSSKQYYKLSSEVENMIGSNVDLVCFEDISDKFKERIEKEGMIIYDRTRKENY